MSFFDSEMERSFLKAAKKKGWVKDEPKIVRQASVEKIAATGNVDVDICCLINGLRERGHEKQAQDLEKSFLEYKQAASALYNVSGEDGDKFLETAHPEGDVHVEQAQDDNGSVETLISTHKKMREIALKEPSKKKSIADIVAQITKKAAEDYGALNMSGLIENLSYEVTMPMIIQMFAKNSGDLYNFLNIYYNEFFNGMYNYYTDLYNVFGEPRINRVKIIQALNSNPELYLNKISDVINTGDLFAAAKTQSAIDYVKWFFVNREYIADQIVERFEAKYPGIEKAFAYVNSDIPNKMKGFASQLKSVANDPLKLFNVLSTYSKNGVSNYISMALAGFHGLEYANSYMSSFKTAVERVTPAVEEAVAAKRNTVQRQEGAKNETAINRATSAFQQASRLLMGEMKTPEDSDAAKQNAGTVYQLSLALTSGWGWPQIQAYVKKLTGQDVQTMEDVANIANQWLEWAKSKAK